MIFRSSSSALSPIDRENGSRHFIKLPAVAFREAPCEQPGRSLSVCETKVRLF